MLPFCSFQHLSLASAPLPSQHFCLALCVVQSLSLASSVPLWFPASRWPPLSTISNLKFLHLRDAGFFCGLLDAPPVHILNHFFSSLPQVGLPFYFLSTNISICPLLFFIPNLYLYDGKFFIVVHIFYNSAR